MTARPDILCIGSALWDVIGRSAAPMTAGADVPGLIERQPGGVALNLALALRGAGLSPALLTAVGDDAQGVELLAACGRLGVETALVHVVPGGRTDRYMAIEGAGALVAAIADAHTLEAAGEAILWPLSNGRLGHDGAPYDGHIAIDGNLTEQLLTKIAQSALFDAADLRVIPASPGKIGRIRPLMRRRATFYLNMEEACGLAGTAFEDSAMAARTLLDLGACRVLITDGGGAATDADHEGIITMEPPRVDARRVTGAGDRFTATHIAAEMRGEGRESALSLALSQAADFVAGIDP